MWAFVSLFIITNWPHVKLHFCPKGQFVWWDPHALSYLFKGGLSYVCSVKLIINLMWTEPKVCCKQMCIFRASKESMSDGITLLNDDAQRLLRTIKEFMQMTSDEQPYQSADENRSEFNSFRRPPACLFISHLNIYVQQLQRCCLLTFKV